MRHLHLKEIIKYKKNLTCAAIRIMSNNWPRNINPKVHNFAKPIPG